MQANHPVMFGAAEGLLGSMTGTSPLLAAYNLYHNLSSNGNPLGSLGNSLSGLFSGSNNGPGFSAGDVSQSLNDLSGMGQAGNGGGGAGQAGGGQAGGGPVAQPVPGMSGSPTPSSYSYTPQPAPLGGYWNQQAIQMANPVYGPYAGGLAALGGH